MNGGTVGDEEGEYTFTGGRGNSVMDYVIGKEGIRKNVRRVYIGEKIDSDHHPVEIWIKGEGRKRKENKGKKKVKGWREVWTEEGKRKFERRLKKKGIGGEKVGLGINKE